MYNILKRMRKMLAVRLDKEIEQRLQNLAERTHRTKSFYVKQALSEYLNDLEDLYLAEQRVLELRAGNSETISLERLRAEYELAH